MLLAHAPPPSPSAFSSPALSVRAFRRRRLAAPGAAATAASKSPSLPGGQRRKQVASVANPLVKHCVKLRDSAAYRRSCRRLVLVGLAPILEICRLGFAAIDCLLLLDGAEVPDELHELSGGNAVYVSATVMKKISGMQSVDSTEAIAVMHMPRHFCDLSDDEGGAGLDASFQSPKRILVLDGIQVKKMSGTPPLFSSSPFVQKMGHSHIVRGAVAYLNSEVVVRGAVAYLNSEVVYLQYISQAWISILYGASDPVMILISDTWQDPGNLGTLIRSACAFKWDGVFLLPACCDPFNEKALRAARGASLQLPIVSGNWCDLHDLVTKYGMKMLAGHPESSSDGSERTHVLSKELADSLMSESLCLVLGSEGNGLSEETVQACDLVSIPMEEMNVDGSQVH